MFPFPSPTCIKVFNTNIPQLLPPRPTPRLRCRQPKHRNHRLSPSEQTPGHQGHIHQWSREGNLRQELTADVDSTEGCSAEGCIGREAEDRDETCQVYQRQCERYLVAIPQRADDGLERAYGWMAVGLYERKNTRSWGIEGV